jgi:hypothetical protein
MTAPRMRQPTPVALMKWMSRRRLVSADKSLFSEASREGDLFTAVLSVGLLLLLA